MKKTKIIFWIITVPMALFMVFSAWVNVISTPESVELISKQLGYPAYFIPFIGVLKILGVIAILIPGYYRIKEWAYAGIVFDLVAATFSMIAIGAPASGWSFMVLPILFVFGSYIYYHKLVKLSGRSV